VQIQKRGRTTTTTSLWRHCGADVPGARANTKKEEEQQQHVIVVLMSPEREPSPGKG